MIGWEVYAQLEPFGEIRADYRAASIVAMLANVNRDPKKRPKPYTLEDFLLQFGEPEPKRQQTWQEQQKIFMLLAAAYSTPEK